MYGQVLLATFLWAGTNTAGAVAATGGSPVALALLRCLCGAVVLLVVTAPAGRRIVPELGDLPRIVMLGALGAGGYSLLFLSGLALAGPTYGALIGATPPMWVVVISALRTGRMPRPLILLGIATSTAGVVAIVGLDTSAVTSPRVLVGCALLVAAAVAWAGFTVLSAPLLVRHSPLHVITWATAAGAVLLLPVTGIAGGFGVVTDVRAEAWLGLGYLIVLGTVVAPVLWCRGVAAIGASRTSILLNLEAVWGVTIASVATATVPTPAQLTGGLLIVAGAAVVQRVDVERTTVVLQSRQNDSGLMP